MLSSSQLSSKWPFFLILMVAFGIASCSTGPSGVGSERHPQAETEGLSFTTNHIDFAKWDRKPECCSAQGSAYGIAAGGTYSAKAGAEVLERGCNLVDAAIATTFTLAVERPQSTGIGGGGFLTLHLAKKKGQKADTDVFVDFRETAPRSATADMFLNEKGEEIPNLSRDGVHAAGTPGFVAGMFEVYQKYGTNASARNPKCGWRELLKPAIRLAKEGFIVYPSLEERILIRKGELTKDPEATQLFFKDGGLPLKSGFDRLIQADLAKTLELIAKGGKNAFYRGELAQKIAAYVKNHARPGIPAFDEQDLAEYKPRFLEPLIGEYKGYKIITAPPPSAGGVTLIESLNILSGFDLAASKNQSDYIHLLAETLRRAYADRYLIGDLSDKKPYEAVLTAEYADRARKLINLEKAGSSANVKTGELIPEERNHTSHASLMDNKGNAVSVTTTVNYYFGSADLVTGTGFFLNDEMDDFSKKVGAANLTGLIGAAPNAVAPGKRPVSSMVPTIVMQSGKPVLVVGAAGSSTIISGVMQTLLNDLVIWPHDLKKAVFAGRIHHQWMPDALTMEPKAFPPATEAALKKMGHNVQPSKFAPQVQAVDFNPGTQTFTAVHEPRDEGGAEAK